MLVVQIATWCAFPVEGAQSPPQSICITNMYTYLTELKWHRFDVIYYEYGALVLLYTNPERASRSFKVLQEASFDDKSILVLLLPNIQVRTDLCSSLQKTGGTQWM